MPGLIAPAAPQRGRAKTAWLAWALRAHHLTARTGTQSVQDAIDDLKIAATTDESGKLQLHQVCSLSTGHLLLALHATATTLLKTLHSLHCTHCAALTALHPRRCIHCIAPTALHSLHCTRCAALTALHPLRCIHCIAPTALHSLHCTHCAALTALHPLRCIHCIAPAALHSWRCTHCIVVPGFLFEGESGVE